MSAKKQVRVKNLTLGDGNIYVQSMLNVKSTDIEGSINQALELQNAGCDIVRAAVPDMKAVELIEKLKENISIPLVADIHFDYRLALACADAGVDKIRINPGNIGDESKIKQVVDKCKQKKHTYKNRRKFGKS